ncbi:MAG TPA: MFS transporter [Beijerinckiaceae bacterium]|jgi:MFS family permease
MDKPVSTGRPPRLAALRERNFVLYLIGQFTSQLGSWIELTAVSWIVYEMTNSPTLLGLVGLFRATPTIVLALFGGAIADRVTRRTLLLCTETTMLAASLLVGLLAATGRLEYWHLYILNLVSGTLQAFSVPARHALMANLVPRPAVRSAVTLNSIAVRSGGLIGPSIAGLTLAYGGYALPFFLNAASFVGMLAALVLMRLTPAQARATVPKEGLGRGLTGGVAFVWRSPLLRVALALELASGLFGHNSALLTIIVRDVLDAGPEALGLIMSALSAGAMLGVALLVTFHVERHGRVILGVGAAYTVTWALFAFSSSLWLSVILALVLGALDSTWGVTRNTVAQLLVPDALRGRVMSVVMLITRGGSQLGRVQSGFIAGMIGAPGTVLVGAAVIGATLLASARIPLPETISEPVPVGEGEEAA